MRRFELAIAPLLARLGYSRPDEDPLQSADEIRPVMMVGDFRTAVPSPGGGHQIFQGSTGAVGPGLFGVLIFGPPAGGAWLHQIVWHPGAGSYGVLTMENETTFAPGLVNSGTGGEVGRFDAREPGSPLTFQGGTSTALVSPSALLPPDAISRFYPPIWWYGDSGPSISPLSRSGRITIQCQNANEVAVADVIYSVPLAGVRRQVL